MSIKSDRLAEQARTTADWLEQQNERPNMPYEPVPHIVRTIRVEAAYHCVQCREKKAGRFTRHQHAAGGGWTQGRDKVMWFCWDCLPKGDGRGEVPSDAA